jgi:hypothetical protein
MPGRVMGYGAAGPGLRPVDLPGLLVLRPGPGRAERSGFRCGYSVYQAEYSPNLLFESGAQTEAPFDRILDRTRSRLDIPAIRTLSGLKTRPHRTRKAGPPAQEIVIGKPR